jgi:FkbM family methyltransferase
MKIVAKLNRIAWKLWPYVTRSISLIPSTIITSICEKQFVVSYFDGQDYIYHWENNTLALMTFVTHPTRQIAANVNFFTQVYRPKSGQTVLDVGSSYGTEMKYFSDLCGSTGKVICIEADKNAFRLMEKMASKMQLTNVVLLNVAVSNSNGIGFLEANWTHGTSNRLIGRSTENTDTVIMLKLEDIIASLELEKIDYIKMNIEGAEFDALLGFGNSINMIENFCISCHDFLGQETATKNQVLQLLAQNNIATVPPNLENNEAWALDYVFAKKV